MCLRCSTRRRSAGLAFPPVRACSTSIGGSAQGESTGSVTWGTWWTTLARAPLASGILGLATCVTRGVAAAGGGLGGIRGGIGATPEHERRQHERGGTHAEQRDDAGHHALAIVPRARLLPPSSG